LDPFLQQQGVDVVQAFTQSAAIDVLRFDEFDALVLDLVLPDGGAIAISDYATYRCPDVPIIAVTSTSFFSGGSILDLIPNARSLMRTPLRLDDLAAVLEHYVPKKRSPKSKPEVA
jgi:DNA-binding NtrC family response regulator